MTHRLFSVKANEKVRWQHTPGDWGSEQRAQYFAMAKEKFMVAAVVYGGK